MPGDGAGLTVRSHVRERPRSEPSNRNVHEWKSPFILVDAGISGISATEGVKAVLEPAPLCS
jgi:hypothetical protein